MRSLILLLAAGQLASAQFGRISISGVPPFDEGLRLHLELSQEQVDKLQANKTSLASRLNDVQRRSQFLLVEIRVELTKPSPDPMAVGLRYAELENICRQSARLSSETRQLNLALLTDAQKAKLKALTDAARLLSLVEEAGAANLYRADHGSDLFASFLLGRFPTFGLGIPGIDFLSAGSGASCGFSPFGGIGLNLPVLP